MKRYVWWYAAGATILAVLVLWPLAAAGLLSGAGDVEEHTTITDYDGDFVVTDDGRMSVTETVTVDFPDSESHGIFRFFDSRDPNAPSLRRRPENISVEVDPKVSDRQKAQAIVDRGGWEADELPRLVEKYGQADGTAQFLLQFGNYAETEKTTEGWSGRYTDIRIGDEYSELPEGKHTYVLRYEMADVLLPSGDGSRFYWNLIPSGWRQSIAHADLDLTLPADTADVRCAVGRGATDGCATTEGEGTSTLRITADDLPAGTPLTVQAGIPGLATPEITGREWPWSQRWDAVLGTDTETYGVIAGLAIAALLVGAIVQVRTWDRLPRVEPRATPPPDIGPAQAAYLIEKRAKPRLLGASILYAASRGIVGIRSTQNGWRTSTFRSEDVPRPSWNTVDRVTRVVEKFDNLAIGADKNSAAGRRAAKTLGQTMPTFRQRAESWAVNDGLVRREGAGMWLYLVGFVVSALACVVLAIVRPGETTLWALAPGLLAIMLGPATVPSAGLKRTEAGRALAAEAAGFRETLRARSGDFQGDQATYDTYLPWAVAFGCAKQWAGRFKVGGVSSPAAPSYLPYNQHALFGASAVSAEAGAGAVGDLAGALTRDFERSFDSAVRAYQAPSSSGGSGGFSGGGTFSGGGGGGGGSFGGGGGGGDGGGGSW
ncbi:putative membrane protein DUF2207 [Nocardioides albertanoniae]|uniref:Putative membrane protein DUF2207 n=1 Tax=Nocardioides albertanoniae TaxID=1175486 RepID=A0A543A6W2_9ACTN|nr:DUF2207 domain-containing protein [Nocardioides albertanoniae]TQL68352.1 putative membrane protein DUF2207 [Nocardioides albertanoniae]